MAFSPNGDLLLANGQDDDNSIAIYDWKNNKLIATSGVDKARVTDMAFKNDSEFVTIGLKHIKFWTVKGRNLTTFCLFSNNDLLYSGGQDGIIKIFNSKLEIKDTIDMTKMTSFNPGIRSIDMNSGNNLLIGLKGGDVKK